IQAAPVLRSKTGNDPIRVQMQPAVISSFPEPVAPTAALAAEPRRVGSWWLFGVGALSALLLAAGIAKGNRRRIRPDVSSRENPSPVVASPVLVRPERIRHEIAPSVLLLDQSLAAWEFQRSVLTSLGAVVRCPESVEEAMASLKKDELDLLIIDPRFGE